jgi:hypothetical protein
MLDDPSKRLSSGVDGVLAGYTMLAPKEGWARIRAILADPKKEFMLRYSALKAIRFFWDFRPDVIPQKELVDAACLLLDQNDIADLAIEDLRKWKRVEVADRVLDLFTKPSHDVPIIQRSIMRYALSFPEQPRAAALVQEMRQKKPTWVKDVEELLKLDSPPPVSPPAEPPADKKLGAADAPPAPAAPAPAPALPLVPIAAVAGVLVVLGRVACLVRWRRC